MPADVVVLRSPRYLSVFFLILVAFFLTGAAAHVMEDGSPLAVFDWPWVVTVPEMMFFAAVSVANDRLAPRFSADGIRTRGVRIFRYDVVVRWDQVERIWVGRQGMLLVRLRGPDAVAGADTRLRNAMRRRRNRLSADLVLPLWLVRPDRATIGAAVERLSGGIHRLERLGADPVPGADDVVLENRCAMPASLILLLVMTAPWLVIVTKATGLWPLEGRELLVALAGALLLTLVLLPLFLVTMVARMAPPIMGPSGLRLRSANLFTYDTILPWPEVTAIRTGRFGPFPRLLVQVRDPEALAGGDQRLLRRMRRNQARTGSDLVISTFATNRDAAYLADAVAHLSGGARTLEHAA